MSNLTWDCLRPVSMLKFDGKSLENTLLVTDSDYES